MITRDLKLNGRIWVDLSSILIAGSTISNVSGSRVVVRISDKRPGRKVTTGHPVPINGAVQINPGSGTLFIRSVGRPATVVITPGVNIKYGV